MKTIDTEQMIINAGFGEMHHGDMIHWNGCEYSHYECAIKALIDELEATRKERDEYKQKLLDLAETLRDSEDPCQDCELKRKELVKAVDDPRGMWKDICFNLETYENSNSHTDTTQVCTCGTTQVCPLHQNALTPPY